MASEYTQNRRYPLYTDNDKPNLRDQYNGAIREIDADMAQSLADSSAVSNALGAGFDAQHTVRVAIDDVNDEIDGIDAEIGDGFSSSNTVAQQLAAERTARAEADSAIEGKIGDGFSSSDTVSQQLAAERTARAEADSEINGKIGEGFSSSNTVAQQIAAERTARVAADSAIEDKIGAGFSSSSTVAQQLAAERTARTEADASLLGRINARDVTVVIGDSWVDLNRFTDYPQQVRWLKEAADLHNNIFSYGVSGATTGEFSTQLQSAINDSRFNNDDVTRVIIVGGVNDYVRGVSSSTSKNNINTLISSIVPNFKNATITMLIDSVAPFAAASDTQFKWYDDSLWANSIIAGVHCAAYWLGYHLNAQYLMDANTITQSYHVSEAGSATLRTILESVLNDKIPETSRYARMTSGYIFRTGNSAGQYTGEQPTYIDTSAKAIGNILESTYRLGFPSDISSTITYMLIKPPSDVASLFTSQLTVAPNKGVGFMMNASNEYDSVTLIDNAQLTGDTDVRGCAIYGNTSLGGARYIDCSCRNFS